MSKESIQKIKEAEDRAESIVAEAKARAEEMIRAAEAAGVELVRATEENVRAEIASTSEAVRVKTAAAVDRAVERARENAETMRKDVSLRQHGAEKIVMRGLESKCR